jgi:hypothetical protein
MTRSPPQAPFGDSSKFSLRPITKNTVEPSLALPCFVFVLAPNPPKSGEKKALFGVKKKSGEKFVFFCAKWLLLLLALWIIIVSLLFKDGHPHAKNYQGR